MMSRLTRDTLCYTDNPREMCAYNPDPCGKAAQYMLTALPDGGEREEEMVRDILEMLEAANVDTDLRDELSEWLDDRGVSHMMDVELDEMLVSLVDKKTGR